ncbi:hypothetical protein J2T17_006997 [Paenibacillus mucilaginosus]
MLGRLRFKVLRTRVPAADRSASWARSILPASGVQPAAVLVHLPIRVGRMVNGCGPHRRDPPENTAAAEQAGLLTCVSSLHSAAFPSNAQQWLVVSVKLLAYSGGTVPEFHRLPFSSESSACRQGCRHLFVTIYEIVGLVISLVNPALLFMIARPFRNCLPRSPATRLTLTASRLPTPFCLLAPPRSFLPHSGHTAGAASPHHPTPDHSTLRPLIVILFNKSRIGYAQDDRSAVWTHRFFHLPNHYMKRRPPS